MNFARGCEFCDSAPSVTDLHRPQLPGATAPPPPPAPPPPAPPLPLLSETQIQRGDRKTKWRRRGRRTNSLGKDYSLVFVERYLSSGIYLRRSAAPPTRAHADKQTKVGVKRKISANETWINPTVAARLSGACWGRIIFDYYRQRSRSFTQKHLDEKHKLNRLNIPSRAGIIKVFGGGEHTCAPSEHGKLCLCSLLHQY